MTLVAQYEKVKGTIPENVTLVAVSKTHPADMIREIYDAGQRIFGENRPQEMKEKYELLPKDIRWHMIGHLQTNKVKYIAPFVELVHSVDSDRLLAVINKEAEKNNRIIDVLLEVHIALEETKSGWDADELRAYLAAGQWREYRNVRITGLMTVASQTDDEGVIRREFRDMREMFKEFADEYFGSQFDTLSMGMTQDYKTAVDCGATMVRIGSLIFGTRQYNLTEEPTEV